MLCLNFAPVVVTLLLLPVLVSASAAGSCAEPVFIRIHDAPIAFDFAVPSGDAGGYYIDALKRSGLMVPVASCILADALRSLCRAKQPRGVFVDVGAHIGWFSAMAAAHGCDVVAIEPQERATSCIHATVVANAAGWRNVSVSVVHAAAGRASGSATLSDSATSPDWALASVNFDSSNQSSSHPTRVVRIDDAVEEALGRGALSRVVAVKVDVEGAEVKLRARLPLFGVYILSFESFIHSFESFIHSLLQAEALEGAQLSIASASLVFLEVKRDGLTASVFTEKRLALSQMFPSIIWTTHEFFEEIGRKLPPPWGLEWHVLPVHQRQGWEGWPHDRHFDDHVMLRRDGFVSLFLPLEPRVVFEFPPPNFVYPIAGSSDSVKKGAGSLSGTVGIAVYSPGGFTSNHRLTLFIDGVSAMTAPVHSVGEGATYARMTVSLNGWGVEMVGGTLYLECGLLFEGEEVASSGPVPVLATSNFSKLQLRNVDDGLWFRDIHGGPHAFGLEPSGSRWEDDESS